MHMHMCIFGISSSLENNPIAPYTRIGSSSEVKIALYTSGKVRCKMSGATVSAIYAGISWQLSRAVGIPPCHARSLASTKTYVLPLLVVSSCLLLFSVDWLVAYPKDIHHQHKYINHNLVRKV